MYYLFYLFILTYATTFILNYFTNKFTFVNYVSFSSYFDFNIYWLHP